MTYLPVSLVPRCGSEEAAGPVEEEVEAGGEGGVEIVTGPRHPEHPVKHVRICVMPCPPQQLDAHDVKGYVD